MEVVVICDGGLVDIALGGVGEDGISIKVLDQYLLYQLPFFFCRVCSQLSFSCFL